MDPSLTTTLLPAVLVAVAIGGSAATVAGFLGSVSGWLDYAAHFRPHVAVAALVAAAGAGLLLDWPRAAPLVAALVAIATVNVVVILVEARYRAAVAAADGRATLKLASINVNFRNADHASVDRWIRHELPDVLVVTEVDHTWVDAIEGLADLYPHRAIGRTDYVTMLSRTAWSDFELVAGPRAEQGILVARFAVAGTTLTVIGAHPASPVDPRWVRDRDAELAVIARLAAAAPGPVAAMGDFNATPWSAPMRRLVRTSPLRYADLHKTTWPTFLPRWLGLKIDHIMLGNGCAVVDYRVGSNVGSDHRPVVATIHCAGSAPRQRRTGA